MINSAPSQRIAYSSKANASYYALRESILAGVIPPGTQLNQAKLAAELQVSGTPLREALRRLEAEGLVKMRTHRDVVVAPFAPDEVRSLLTVRGRLDGLSIRLAAGSADPASRTLIAEAAANLRDWPAGDWRARPVDADREFHRALYLASGNQVLADLLDGLWDRTDQFHRVIGPMASDSFIDKHQALAGAILDGDPQRAQALMAEHVEAEIALILSRAREQAEAIEGEGPLAVAGA